VKRGGWRLWVLFTLSLSVAIGGLHVALERQGSAESLRERKGRLREARLTPAPEQAASALTEVILSSTSGLEGRALVRSPRGPTSPLPAAVVLGGINRGRRIVTVRGLDAIATGAVLVGLDYPLTARRRAWEGLNALVTAASVRPAAFDTIALVLLTLDYLGSRPDVDPARVFLIGGSLGAPVVTIAGAVDRRPAAVVVLYGGGPVGALITHTLRHPSQHRPWPAWQAWLAGRALAALLTPLEPTRYAAAIAPRPFLMVNGAGDTLVPREHVETLHAAARPPKDLVWVEGEHVQPTETELLARLSGTVVAWLTARGLLAPAP
jgi:dienelactone hydrolase